MGFDWFDCLGCLGQARFGLTLRIALFFLAGLSAPNVIGQIPHGVFSLSASDAPASQIALDNPNVVGISVRQSWADLEPTEGIFDWSYLDSEVARAAAAGKVVMLRIGTQSGKPAWVTTAVQNAGGLFFTFDDDGVLTTIPVFWDPTFLAKRKVMISALGAHFTNNPTVKIVSASFANARSEDWNVPHTDVDIANWFAVGYTSDKLIDAGRQTIDATMAAFPNQYVTLAIGGNGHVGNTGNLDPSSTYVAASVVATELGLWPGRLIVQINSLSAINPVSPGPDGSVWNLLWQNQPNVGAQMLYWCYNEPTYRNNGGVPGDPATVLTASVNAAASYGIGYVEIYQQDVLNLSSVITYARGRLAPLPATPGLLNVSTRLQVGLGDRVAIGGFIVGGTGAKKILVRALGPSLGQSGLVGLLADPFLELHDQTGAVIGTNDNWETTQLGGVIVADQEQAIRDTTIPPTDPAEATIVADLNPGTYTAVVRGASNGTGLGLAEIYDLSQSVPAAVSNLSTRGFVQTGTNALVGGFILGGIEPSNIVVRALGPSLVQDGLTDFLADPVLDLRDTNGTIVASNDNWADTQQAELEASGLAPSEAKEAAIYQALPPGIYTATVTGKNSSVGVGLVEVYRLP